MRKYICLAMCLMAYLLNHAQTFDLDGVIYRIKSQAPAECIVEGLASGNKVSSVTIEEQVVYQSTRYSVVGIAEYAFAGNETLLSIKLPSTVTSIGRNAFQGCQGLTSLSLPSGVNVIEQQTFYDCVSLESIQGPGITEIGISAFYNCISLKEIDFWKSLTLIKEGAFRNCSSLSSVILPDNVVLGEGIFSNCSSLSSVSLPSGIKSIPSYMFSDCIGLREVNGIEKAVEIGENAFYGCSSLEYLSLSPAIISMGRYAFALCSSLNLTEIEGDDMIIDAYAFTGCASFTDIAFKGVVEIGEEAFANIPELDKLHFGPRVFRIKERAFRGCEGITYVESEAFTPPITALSSFPAIVYEEALLDVPPEAMLLYMQSPPWSLFRKVEGSGVNQVEMSESSVSLQDGILKISGKAGLPVRIFTVEGKTLYTGIKDSEEFSVPVLNKGILLVTVGGNSYKILN